MKGAWLRFDVMFCCLLGIGSYMAWGSASLVTGALWADFATSFTRPMWFANVGAHGIGMLVLGLLAPRLEPYSERRLSLVGLPLLAFVGAIVWATGLALEVIGIAVAGSIACGLGTAAIPILWGEVCNELDDYGELRGLLSASVVLGLLLTLMIICLPDVLAFIVCLILPMAMTGCLARAWRILTPPDTGARGGAGTEDCDGEGKSQDAAAQDGGTRDEQPDFDFLSEQLPEEYTSHEWWRLLLCGFVMTLPAGLYQNVYPSSAQGSVVESWGMVLSCVCLIITLLSLLDMYVVKRFGSSLFSRLAMPLLAAGLLILSASNAHLESWGGVSLVTGHYLFLIYIYTELNVFAADTKTKPARVIAYGSCTLDFGQLAGFGLSYLGGLIPSAWPLSAAMIIVYLLIIAGILLYPKINESLENRDHDLQARLALNAGDASAEVRATRVLAEEPAEEETRGGGAGGATGDGDAVGAGSLGSSSGNDMNGDAEEEKEGGAGRSFKQSCKVFGDERGFTSRETEILGYLLCGRTLRSIANETFLSYNTVKTHVSHIYQKSEVHTRDELIDQFEKSGGDR